MITTSKRQPSSSQQNETTLQRRVIKTGFWKDLETR